MKWIIRHFKYRVFFLWDHNKWLQEFLWTKLYYGMSVWTLLKYIKWHFVTPWNLKLKLEACWTIPFDSVNLQSSMFESIGCQQLVKKILHAGFSHFFGVLGVESSWNFPVRRCLKSDKLHRTCNDQILLMRSWLERKGFDSIDFFDFGNRTSLRQLAARQTGSEGRSDACDRWEAYRSILVQPLHYDHVLKQNFLPNHLYFVRVNLKSLDEVMKWSERTWPSWLMIELAMRRNSSRETTIHHPIRGIPETKTRWSCLAELYTDEAGKRGVVWYVKYVKFLKAWRSLKLH